MMPGKDRPGMPSIAVGRRMPCQWIEVGTVRRLVTEIVTVSPSRHRRIGPGTLPLSAVAIDVFPAIVTGISAISRSKWLPLSTGRSVPATAGRGRKADPIPSTPPATRRRRREMTVFIGKLQTAKEILPRGLSARGSAQCAGSRGIEFGRLGAGGRRRGKAGRQIEIIGDLAGRAGFERRDQAGRAVEAAAAAIVMGMPMAARIVMVMRRAGIGMRSRMIGKGMRIPAGDEQRSDDEHPFEPGKPHDAERYQSTASIEKSWR